MLEINESISTDLKVIEMLIQLGWKRGDRPNISLKNIS